MWPGMVGDYNCFVHSDKIQISRQSRDAVTTSLSPSIVQAVCTGRGEVWIFARQNIKSMRLKLFLQSMKFFVSYVRLTEAISVAWLSVDQDESNREGW